MNGGVCVASWLLALSLAEDPDPWQWVASVEPEIRAHLRDRVQVPKGKAREIDWSVAIEADNGWGTTVVFGLWQGWKGSAQARLLTIKARDLSTALYDLRAATPGLTADEALQKLPVETRDMQQCKALDQSASRLRSISIEALPRNYLTLHASGFRVVVWPSFRTPREYSVDLGENELARWAADMLEVARGCGAR
jgi:hypothetical protein